MRNFILLILLIVASTAQGQRKMEFLDRGFIAIPDGKGNVLVSCRLLASDDPGTGFVLTRKTEGGEFVRFDSKPNTKTTCWLDKNVDSTKTHVYHLVTWVNKVAKKVMITYTLKPGSKPYLSLPLQTPQGYTPNDASVGDLDGDGTYEIILHQSGRGRDNSQAGVTDPPIFQAYKLDGTLLWQINLGKNIREGAHYTQFMVYDLDSDGRAEIAMKTADGSIDAKGNVIGDSSKDWRNERGYILSGPEYLTVFNGLTGEALHTVSYLPPRYPSSLTPTTEELKNMWGDGYGNRMDRFLACIAYLDGKNPTLVMCRGYYTRTVLAAWDFSQGKLNARWLFDSDKEGKQWAGQGNHNLSVADVDNDGRDEIIYGAMTIDDNGKGLYTTGLGHGDALHVTDLDPARPGLEVFDIQERFDDAGANFRDARTGEVIWKKASVKAGEDGEGPGRGLALDIDPRYAGYECWVAGAGIRGMFDCKGNKISDSTPACNMGIYWDGDVLGEILNSTNVDKWDYKNGVTKKLLDAADYDCVRNNGTKSNPVLSADIFGDWREEVIYRTRDNHELRIFSTTIPTTYRFYTFMQDPHYRLSIAWQNVAYNQPPHTGFFMGEGMKMPKKPAIQIIPFIKKGEANALK
jgi:rhamnogalacturonan endolyase